MPNYDLSHQQLVDFIQEFIPNIGEEGVCFGLAHMAMQAAIANDLKTFNDRLETISKFPAKDFAARYHHLSSERTRQIAAIKAKYLTLDSKLLSRRKINLAKTTLMQEKFRDLEIIIDSLINENKLSPELRDVELARRKEIALDNQLQQLYIEKELQFKPRDQVILDTMPFLEALTIYHQSDLNPHLFEPGKEPKYQIASASMPLAMSYELQEAGGIAEIDVMTGIYQANEIQNMLQSFIKLIKENPPKDIHSPIVFMLNGINHTINITYDVNRNDWILVDANKLPLRKFTDTQALAEEVISSLSVNQVATFSTFMYSHQNDKQYFSKIDSQWRNSDAWQQAHEVTSEKVGLMDSNKMTWLDVASENDSGEVIQALIDNGAEFDNPNSGKERPLEVAILFENLKIIDVLVRNGVDLNESLPKLGHTPLMYAIINNKKDMVRVLIEQGVDLNIPKELPPLFIAAQEGQKEIVDMLLSANAKLTYPFVATIDELKDFASERGVENAMDAFIQQRLSVYQDQKNNSQTIAVLPHQIAEIMGHTEIAKAIIEKKNSLDNKLVVANDLEIKKEPANVSATVSRRA